MLVFRNPHPCFADVSNMGGDQFDVNDPQEAKDQETFFSYVAACVPCALCFWPVIEVDDHGVTRMRTSHGHRKLVLSHVLGVPY